VLNKRLDLHLARLHESVSWGRPLAEEQLANMTDLLVKQNGLQDQAALQQLAHVVRRQADVLAFADVFVVLTVMFAGMALFAMFMRKPAATMASGGGH